MEAIDVYRWLMSEGSRGSCDAFDAHVVGSIVSLALAESEGRPQGVVDGLGLEAREASQFLCEIFPHAASTFGRLAETGVRPQWAVDELALRDLLRQHTTAATPFEHTLATLVARRAQRPHHLWQDLGLRNRRELSWIMERHFEPLATRNRKDMKWKKFLYRAICRDGGFMICTSPVCSECSDFETCFGDEGGESLLAGQRRAAPTPEMALSTAPTTSPSVAAGETP